MSVVRNGEKVQQWTDRLSRFRRGGETVAAFCRSEGVSEASFYLWKRKLTPTFRSITVRWFVNLDAPDHPALPDHRFTVTRRLSYRSYVGF